MAHPGGRPPKYNSPEEMQVLIDEYFRDCKVNRVLDAGDCQDPILLEDSDVSTDDRHPTVSGLAYALDMSTEGIRNYGNKDEFSATVKTAKLRIELYLEQKLYGNNVTGSIFNLKNNFGWKDKSEQEINAKVETNDTTALEALRIAIESKSSTN